MTHSAEGDGGCSILAIITRFRYRKPIKSKHPQMPGSTLVCLQLILPIGRDPAQIATQRCGIWRRSVHGRCDRIWHRRGDVGGYHGCYRDIRHGLRVRLVSHSYPEASGRVDLIVLILRLLRWPARKEDGVNRHAVARCNVDVAPSSRCHSTSLSRIEYARSCVKRDYQCDVRT